jgi:tol-pal system protein YbgF
MKRFRLLALAAFAMAAPAAYSTPLLRLGDIASTRAAPLVLAQTADATYRVNQLEGQVRQLNGKIEEMNFLLLQLQEQLRKMQEDNEYRFQEIEQRRGIKQGEDAGPRKQDFAAKESAAKGDAGSGQAAPLDPIARKLEESGVRTIDGVEIYEGKPGQQDAAGEQTLGKLVFDANGNVIDTELGKPVELAPPNGQGAGQGGAPGVGQDGSVVAALPPADDGSQVYDLGYTYVQAGDYRLAAQSFRKFVADYPRHKKIPEARFWLGESLLAQGQNEEAARILLETHKKYPKSRLAAQTLLKLGVSLAAMNQRELACATFAEVGKKYPDASNAVRAKVVAEQKAASCKAG